MGMFDDEYPSLPDNRTEAEKARHKEMMMRLASASATRWEKITMKALLRSSC